MVHKSQRYTNSGFSNEGVLVSWCLSPQGQFLSTHHLYKDCSSAVEVVPGGLEMYFLLFAALSGWVFVPSEPLCFPVKTYCSDREPLQTAEDNIFESCYSTQAKSSAEYQWRRSFRMIIYFFFFLKAEHFIWEMLKTYDVHDPVKTKTFATCTVFC